PPGVRSGEVGDPFGLEYPTLDDHRARQDTRMKRGDGAIQTHRKRALSRSGCTHDHDHLAPAHGQRDIVERELAALGVAEREMFEANRLVSYGRSHATRGRRR